MESNWPTESELRKREKYEIEKEQRAANAPEEDLYSAFVKLRHQTTFLLRAVGLPEYQRPAHEAEGPEIRGQVVRIIDELAGIREDQRRAIDEIILLRGKISDGLKL